MTANFLGILVIDITIFYSILHNIMWLPHKSQFDQSRVGLQDPTNFDLF